MSLFSGALARGRALAEARMTDTVQITRAGAKVWDEATGTYTTPQVVVYAGPARIKLTSTVVGDVAAGGQMLAAQSPRMDLPVGSSGGVRVNDTVTVTASVNDPASVGVRLNVEGVFWQTDATARRFSVEVQS